MALPVDVESIETLRDVRASLASELVRAGRFFPSSNHRHRNARPTQGLDFADLPIDLLLQREGIETGFLHA